MRAFSQREKILMVLVGATGLVGVSLWVHQQMNDHLAQLSSELVSLQQKLQAETQSAKDSEVPSPVVFESDLLRTLGSVPSAARLSIQKLDRSSETVFKLTLKGAFQDLMPVISRFEREKNPFQILRLEIQRSEVTADKPIDRLVEAVLYLQQRKGAG